MPNIIVLRVQGPGKCVFISCRIRRKSKFYSKRLQVLWVWTSEQHRDVAMRLFRLRTVATSNDAKTTDKITTKLAVPVTSAIGFGAKKREKYSARRTRCPPRLQNEWTPQDTVRRIMSASTERMNIILLQRINVIFIFFFQFLRPAIIYNNLIVRYLVCLQINIQYVTI